MHLSYTENIDNMQSMTLNENINKRVTSFNKNNRLGGSTKTHFSAICTLDLVSVGLYFSCKINMDKWVQLNNQAAGRDKIARLIQYASRAMWDSLESNNCHPALVDNFKTVEYILSTFRKRKSHCFYFNII